jgi:hypothetical protein
MAAATLLFAGSASAQLAKNELIVDYKWPTTHEDSSPIPVTGPGSLSSARFEWGTCAGPNMDTLGTVQGAMVIPYPQKQFKTLVTPGIKCVRGYANTTLNVESGPSNLGRYFPGPSPVAATTTAKVAYEMRKKSDGDYQFVNVGTVQLGVKCGKKLISPYFTIDAAKITKPLKGGVIAAKCN